MVVDVELEPLSLEGELFTKPIIMAGPCSAESEEQVKPVKSKIAPVENTIAFNAPIERQGIPVNDFLKTAHQFSNKIYNQ